ncbi:helix-turn-helix transcriptional regulator [Paenibacillus frigoriresistens]|uniref:helix-turn-helix domain-containing protein n=1 Tax=Paenibacillus alginolyticus TaxID=59839 RepID=UPI001566C050|nr:helix-turn-helix transcriptional regulator [Paenibacillus frigoriresistens]NRF93420.1 helix-turn-helix transcriptional regulator [Paenibacillus frigoriresistens]
MKGRPLSNIELASLREMTFGGRVEWFREELNKLNPKEFTSTKVAEHLNISSQGLRNIERGIIKDPGFSIVTHLSELYKVPTSAFLDKFYKNLPSTLTLGIDENTNESEVNSFDDNEEKWHICSQVILIKNNEYKLIASETSKKVVSEYATITTLANLFNQMEIVNCQGDDPLKIDIQIDKNTPMMKALQAYNRRHELKWKPNHSLNAYVDEFSHSNPEGNE